MLARNFRTAVICLAAFTCITGVLYPLLVTGIAQIIFTDQANGSIIEQNGRAIGSRLIGQPFSGPRYFWSRPSSTSPSPYNAAASSGSNYGPLNPVVLKATKDRIDQLHFADPSNRSLIPVDLVTASSSGLDPHVSVAAALYQAPRVARERRLLPERIHELIDQCTEGRVLGFLGEPGVNVLKLNLLLDDMPKGSN